MSRIKITAYNGVRKQELDTAGLRAVALVVPQGPWGTQSLGDVMCVYSHNDGKDVCDIVIPDTYNDNPYDPADPCRGMRSGEMDGRFDHPDNEPYRTSFRTSEYIAVMSPTTVLALLDRIAELEAAPGAANSPNPSDATPSTATVVRCLTCP